MAVMVGFLLSGPMAFAQQRAAEGVEFCAENAKPGPAAQEICYLKWESGLQLVLRYLRHGGILDESNEPIPLSLSAAFSWNPFRVNPRDVFGGCSATQLFNGNMFSGVSDYAAVWECIARRDKSVAGWGAI